MLSQEEAREAGAASTGAALRLVGKDDPVNAPAHYTRLEPQPVDVIEAWDLPWHEAQVLKYIARAGHKGDRLTDLRKAKFYLDRLVAKLERG